MSRPSVGDCGESNQHCLCAGALLKADRIMKLTVTVRARGDVCTMLQLAIVPQVQAVHGQTQDALRIPERTGDRCRYVATPTATTNRPEVVCEPGLLTPVPDAHGVPAHAGRPEGSVRTTAPEWFLQPKPCLHIALRNLPMVGEQPRPRATPHRKGSRLLPGNRQIYAQTVVSHVQRAIPDAVNGFTPMRLRIARVVGRDQVRQCQSLNACLSGCACRIMGEAV